MGLTIGLLAAAAYLFAGHRIASNVVRTMQCDRPTATYWATVALWLPVAVVAAVKVVPGAVRRGWRKGERG